MPRLRILLYLIPLVVFGAMVALFMVGLERDPKLVPSPLIGKPAPAFDLELLDDPSRRIDQTVFLGQVSLLNVWASWCPACRQEHPFLMELKRRGEVPIYGLDWKDEREEGLAWLARFGNPYTAVAYDPDNRAGLDWGVYGAPETFLIDARGIIRHKHVGPLTPAVWEQEFRPLIARLKAE